MNTLSLATKAQAYYAYKLPHSPGTLGGQDFPTTPPIGVVLGLMQGTSGST